MPSKIQLPRITAEMLLGAIAGGSVGYQVGGSSGRRAGYSAGEHGVSKIKSEAAGKWPGRVSGAAGGAAVGALIGKHAPGIVEKVVKGDSQAMSIARGTVAGIAAGAGGLAAGKAFGHPAGYLAGKLEHSRIVKQKEKNAQLYGFFDELEKIGSIPKLEQRFFSAVSRKKKQFYKGLEKRVMRELEDMAKNIAESEGSAVGSKMNDRIGQLFKKSSLEKQAIIKKEGGKFVLYTHDGSRVLGRHDSKEEALAQERAIKAHGG